MHNLQKTDSRKASVKLKVTITAAILLGCFIAYAIMWKLGWNEARKEGCIGQIFQIGFTLRNYFAIEGKYPPHVSIKTNEKSEVSWRVAILPYIESAYFYKQYRLEEPWNSPNNFPLRNHECGNIFLCPSVKNSANIGKTSYLAVTGPGSVWTETCAGNIRNPEKEFPDKIIIIEVPESDIFWTEPKDISIDDVVTLFKAKNGLKDSRHSGGLNYISADGKSKSFSQISNVEELIKLLKISD
jgi:hypothetical protein